MTQHTDAFATLSTEHLLELLTPEEKVALTAGQDWWRTKDIKRLGIPAIKVSIWISALQADCEDYRWT